MAGTGRRRPETRDEPNRQEKVSCETVRVDAFIHGCGLSIRADYAGVSEGEDRVGCPRAVGTQPLSGRERSERRDCAPNQTQSSVSYSPIRVDPPRVLAETKTDYERDEMRRDGCYTDLSRL